MKLLYLGIIMVFFSACSVNNYNKTALGSNCEFGFSFKYDPIYNGLNQYSKAKACKMYEKGRDFLSKANTAFDFLNSKNTNKKVDDFLLYYVMDQNIARYEGRFYELVLLHLYAGMNELSLGKNAKAKEHFNQALIANNMQEIYKKNQHELLLKGYKELDIELTHEQKIKAFYTKSLLGLKPSKAYKNDYVSLFIATYFYTQGKYEKAYELASRLSIPYPLLEKWLLLFKAAKEGQKQKKQVFVFYENGQNMSLGSVYLTLPFSMREHFVSVGSTFVVPLERDFAYDIYVNKQTLSPFFDFDGFVSRYFLQNQENIVLKSMLRSLAKARHNVLAFINATEEPISSNIATQINGIYNIISMIADKRYWEFLFKRIDVKMLENDGNLSIKADGVNLYQTKIDKNKDIIIFIKAFKKGEKIQVNIFK